MVDPASRGPVGARAAGRATGGGAAAGGAVGGAVGEAVGGAASLAVRDLLTGPSRAGRVLAAFPSAVYVAAGADVVALVTADGVRLPNALVLAAAAGRGPFRGLAAGAPATAGGGRVTVGAAGGGAARGDVVAVGAAGGGPGSGVVEVRVGRWWDPRPRLGAVDPAVLAANAAAAGRTLAPAAGSQVLLDRAVAFEQACRALDSDGVVAAGLRLLGLGDGLTPAGDDLLAGTIAGWRLFGDACGGPAGGPAGRRMHALADRLAGSLDPSAGTTALSAALLRHAAAGEVAAPAARVCEALAGRGPLAPAVTALADVGHSSGVWLLRGLLTAAAHDE